MNTPSVIQEENSSNTFVDSIDNRRYNRTKISIPLTLFSGLRFFGKKWAARSVNLSQFGLQIFIKDERTVFKVGKKLKVALPCTPETMTAGFPAKKLKLEAIVTRSWATIEGVYLTVRFERPLNEMAQIEKGYFQAFVTLAMMGVVIGLILFLKHRDVKWYWYDPLLHTYSLMAGFFFLSRIFLSLFYREPKDKGYMPSISVIISVKNEQDHIAETVDRIFKTKYPRRLMELIVIDDGSDDKTWDVLKSIEDKYPKLRLVKFPENRGKRHGMAVGAESANGEILVYVDSDSYMEHESFYRIVQPFYDRKVAAVAGHTRVILEDKNIISKMEAVRYFISHQLFKTAESIFGTVTCCPGAFSAYRKKAVLEVLPKWLNQTFLGVKATFGDDRSLTNYILRNYKVLYHSNANCVTFVPSNFKTFFRQQLRWKKSWAREAPIAGFILLKKHPIAFISFFVGTIVTLCSPLVFLRAVIYGPAILGVSPLSYFIGVSLVYLLLCLIYLHQTKKSNWYYGLIFAVLYLCVLCWQTYYAILTMNKTHWGTR
ncbi:MAG: glycosyltransferase [Elusimicrobiota bacterium]